MRLPPPKVCKRIRKLHAQIGSSGKDANVAKQKLSQLCTKMTKPSRGNAMHGHFCSFHHLRAAFTFPDRFKPISPGPPKCNW